MESWTAVVAGRCEDGCARRRSHKRGTVRDATPRACRLSHSASYASANRTRYGDFRNDVSGHGRKFGSQRGKNSARRHIQLLARGDEAHRLVRGRDGYTNSRHRPLADQLSQSSRRSAEREEIKPSLAPRRRVTTILPTPAHFRATTPPRAPYFLSRSFPAARFRKCRRKFRQLLDLWSRGRQLYKHACRVCVRSSRRPLAFFPRASADPDFPRP